jgi:CheY-like chemotaxis protein
MSRQSNGATDVTTIPTSRFLLVDDDPALLLALSGTLQSRLGPCSVDACESGMQALDFIETHTYDTIITDVTMPGMDGLQFLRAVKTSRCDAPIFLMSGKADYALMTEVLKAGASSFFAKPFDRDEIVATLQEGVALSRLKGILRKEETVIRRSNHHRERLIEKLHQYKAASTMPAGDPPPVDQALQRRTDYRATMIRQLAILDKFLLKLTEIHRGTSNKLSVVRENIRRHALSGLLAVSGPVESLNVVMGRVEGLKAPG